MMNVIDSLCKLRNYCEKEDFKGWDPYDGLSSRLFQAVPFLRKSDVCRLVMIQGFKRFPLNLRRIAMIPKEHNAKGIALFLSGYCNLYRIVSESHGVSPLGSGAGILEKIHYLARKLLEMRSEGDWHGACWGYNFDWQSRRSFLFPKNTPTVVATSFCVTALLDAYGITGEKEYLDTALSSAQFVINDLHRTPMGDDGGFIFSYSPLKGNDTVYNASILGAKILALCYHHTRNEEYLRLASSTIRACCECQREDGAWAYGMLPVQSWVDSFHTGYNLDGIHTYREVTGDTSFDTYFDKGFRYYIDNFFEADGCPKYYDNRKYPIDIHCPGQLFVTLSTTHRFDEYAPLAQKVAAWTIRNMQASQGYFYYQLKRGISSRIPYMRWSNAFMFNALSHYLKNNR